MKNGNIKVFSLLTGLVAGGAIAYFLKSEKGQQILDISLNKRKIQKNSFLDNRKEIVGACQNAIDKAIDNNKHNFGNIAIATKELFGAKIEELGKEV